MVNLLNDVRKIFKNLFPPFHDVTVNFLVIVILIVKSYGNRLNKTRLTSTLTLRRRQRNQSYQKTIYSSGRTLLYDKKGWGFDKKPSTIVTNLPFLTGKVLGKRSTSFNSSTVRKKHKKEVYFYTVPSVTVSTVGHNLFM